MSWTVGSRSLWAKGLLLGLLAALGLSIAPAQAAAPVVDRLSGADRYITSAAVSAASFPTGVAVAYVATGATFPDALAGAAVAGRDHAPLLLVRSAGIPSAIAAELQRLKPKRIVVLGGTGSVSTAVAQALTAYTTGSVTRVAGSDRFATAARLSEASFAPDVSNVFVATGTDFPDAVSGSAAAGAQGVPVLLVGTTTVPSATKAELVRLSPARITILGGTGAVSSAVATALGKIAPVTRIAGADRYATATLVSKAAFPTATRALLATGTDFADALSGGSVAAGIPGPILLSRSACLPTVSRGELTRLGAGRVTLLGGTGALSGAVASLVPCQQGVGEVTYADHVAQWNVLCSNDHNAADDPILYPGQFGASHMHTFFGNRSTNAVSTLASLKATTSSCGRDMGTSDRSAYWVPSLMKKNTDGTSSIVGSQQLSQIYYRRAGGGRGPGVYPFPPGLRMIAGSAKATSDQPLSIVSWSCGRGGPESPHMLRCAGGSSAPLVVSLGFPSCWDGVHLDSADHKSHMAYAAGNGACPASHPISLPELNIEVEYVNLGGGPDYFLASGGIYSFHGDFFNAWDNRVQNALVSTCLNGARECANINRSGDTLFRPSYDPEPITIDLNKFSNTSPWDGQPLQEATSSSSPGTMTTSHMGH